MKRLKFIRKPFLTLVVVTFVALAIIYIESQKPDLSQIPTNYSKDILMKSVNYRKAPNFAGIEKWINSMPLTMDRLNGKVVLVDFWTYTCINCIRTIPYLNEWDKKYRNDGLVIVGVHTPEFEFEKKYENVLKAVSEYQIKYPVAQDNNYATWSAYQNRYWPHKYLIDMDGYIRYDHIGEGNYDETEKMIQVLLKERMERIKRIEYNKPDISQPQNTINVDFYNINTPEIYFGYKFSRGNFGNPEGIKPNQIVDYKFPSSITSNNAYFEGKWKSNEDNMELADDEGSILLIFKAKSANIVAGSDNSNSSNAFVYLDNEIETNKNKGHDVIIKENNSISKIKDFRLYNIASAEEYGTHSININAAGKGFKIYTFTFG